MISVRNIIATCIVLFLFGCGGTDQGSVVDHSATSVTTAPTAMPASTSSPGSPSDRIWAEVSAGNDRPSIVVLPHDGTPENLVIEDVTAGTGEEALVGDLLEVKYVGALLDDGSEFDASWNRGQTFFIHIGVGAVIPGWDQGIVGMREGGRRLLKIPSDLAYGEAGAGGSIGPNTPLLFVVDLLRIQG